MCGPTKRVFMLGVMFLFGTALLLSGAANIWVLVLAFKEKTEQGLLCLVVPCYFRSITCYHVGRTRKVHSSSSSCHWETCWSGRSWVLPKDS